jgi:hypothetical protein
LVSHSSKLPSFLKALRRSAEAPTSSSTSLAPPCRSLFQRCLRYGRSWSTLGTLRPSYLLTSSSSPSSSRAFFSSAEHMTLLRTYLPTLSPTLLCSLIPPENAHPPPLVLPLSYCEPSLIHHLVLPRALWGCCASSTINLIRHLNVEGGHLMPSTLAAPLAIHAARIT